MSARRTLLVVSGGGEAVAGIRRAQEMGLHVVVSDADPNAPGLALADDRLLVELLIYDRAHDANCCPSRGSIFVELRPGDGRFDLGRVWRGAPDEEPR